ncbi:hypothetical protein FQR65_LT15387 [Abscondita terminalis]|nr:hypothetical protein FQR65_LT15387 [Abscondita terminalis]
MPKYLTHRELEIALEEIANELEADRGNIDAVYIPPEVDELTDEEIFEEGCEKSNENVDIAGTFEIHTYDDDLNYDDSDDEPLAKKEPLLCGVLGTCPVIPMDETGLEQLFTSTFFQRLNVCIYFDSYSSSMSKNIRKYIPEAPKDAEILLQKLLESDHDNDEPEFEDQSDTDREGHIEQ